MPNNFLILGMLGTVGWVVVNGPTAMEPTVRPAVSRVATTDLSVSPSGSAGRSPALETGREPVPLVRNVRVPPASPVVLPSNETSIAGTEQQAQEDLDRKAAKAAVETALRLLRFAFQPRADMR